MEKELNNKSCSIFNCKHKHYAREYCRKHYANLLRTGNPYGKKRQCNFLGCTKTTLNTYCYYHKKRIRRLEYLKENPLIFEYPNHGLMKKNRRIKMELTKGKCEICGNPAHHIHHKDLSKDNHALDNLLAICAKCHSIIHYDSRKKTSKYVRLYGMTAKEMSQKFGGSMTFYYYLHKRGTLKDFITNPKELYFEKKDGNNQQK